MTYHVAAFSEQIAAAGTLQAIAAVADDQVFTSGDDVRVPQGLPNLLAAFSIGPGQTRARIVAPSLRALANLELSPQVSTEAIGGAQSSRLISMVRNPLPLAVGESVNYETDGGAGGGVGQQTGVIFLGDGPVQPVSGEIRTIRATASIVGTEALWVSGGITFSEDLPSGNYAVVGGRCVANNPGAFRLIFVSGGPRPGSLSTPSDAGDEIPGGRMGGWGVWGQFNTNQPPTLDILSLAGASSAQVLYLDIMRVGGI